MPFSLEAITDPDTKLGQVSQSVQLAPFNAEYQIVSFINPEVLFKNARLKPTPLIHHLAFRSIARKDL